VYRLLAQRLTLVAIVVCIIFAAIAYVTEQNRIQDVIVDLARIQVQRFNRQVFAIYDDSAGIDGTALQLQLDRFSAGSGEAELRDGHFVLARVYDRSRAQLAQISDSTYPKLDIVEKRLDLAELPPLAKDDIRVVTVRLGGSPFVGVALPMLNSSDEVMGQLIGVFAVSAEAIARTRSDIFRTILYVVAIVLLTSVAIFPIIGGLLGRLSRLTFDLLDANLETMQILGSAIAKRDSDTDAHNFRVSVYSVALAEKVGMTGPQIQSLIKGALLHDVGKLGIRDNVLLKPGKLDTAEFEVMKTHVEHGLDITSRAKWLDDARDVVGGHHEKFDGAGYPRGLAGQDIPINARIFAIVDVFDALTSKRPYKDPFSFDETMAILENGRGTHFDPDLLDAFKAIARELYDEYHGQHDDKPRQQLETISQRYFKSDVKDLMA
jgi:HD-GYP domain-containing protein (c-di-GMP phosphodiesterase class II)